MDHLAPDIDHCRTVQMGGRTMGLLWLPEASNAWGFRSSKALDGDHNASTRVDVVLLRFAVLGVGLSTVDCLP